MKAPQRGVAYLVLLASIAILGAATAATATIWSQAQRRERERQLLWVGDQYRRALLSYAAKGGGVFPKKLEDLVEDPRSPAPRRFLRRLYEDPMTGEANWVIVRDRLGGIAGLHSRSEAKPLKTGQFPGTYAGFARAASYADWVFLAGAPASSALGRPGARLAPEVDAAGRAAAPAAAPGRGAASGTTEAVTPAPSGQAASQPATDRARSSTEASSSPAAAPAAPVPSRPATDQDSTDDTD